MARAGLDRAICCERADPERALPPWVRRQSLERYRWACRFVRGAVVLDAACGTGYGSLMLAESGRAEAVVGVDQESEALAVAAGRSRWCRTVRFMRASVERLPFPDRCFDVYVSFETIEHIAEPEVFLAEAWRVLKPHGRLLLSTPNRLVTNPQLPPDGRPLNPYHVREFDPAQLCALLTPHWERVELWGMCLFPKAYVELLGGLPAPWLRLPARIHQLVKLPLEVFGSYPECEPVRCTVRRAERAEYLLMVCERPKPPPPGSSAMGVHQRRSPPSRRAA